MPTYDYHCTACDHHAEIFHSMSEKPRKKCPECGKLKLERQIGMGGGIIFKGSGFYNTDYRSGSYQADKAKDAPGTSSGPGTSGSSGGGGCAATE